MIKSCFANLRQHRGLWLYQDESGISVNALFKLHFNIHKFIHYTPTDFCWASRFFVKRLLIFFRSLFILFQWQNVTLMNDCIHACFTLIFFLPIHKWALVFRLCHTPADNLLVNASRSKMSDPVEIHFFSL